MFPHASAGPSFQLAMFAREVPGDDQPDDAERLAKGRGHAASDRNRLAAVLVDGARVEVEDLRDHPDLAAGARDRFADVLRLDPRELFGVLFDERREPAQETRPVGRRDRAPGRECLLRSSDGGVCLLHPACSSSAIGSSVAGLRTVSVIAVLQAGLPIRQNPYTSHAKIGTRRRAMIQSTFPPVESAVAGCLMTSTMKTISSRRGLRTRSTGHSSWSRREA